MISTPPTRPTSEIYKCRAVSIKATFIMPEPEATDHSPGFNSFRLSATTTCRDPIRRSVTSECLVVANRIVPRIRMPTSGFLLENNRRPPPDAREIPEGLVIGTIYYLDAPADDDFANFFELTLKPALIDKGASILGYFVTECSTNTFPALPVREGVHVFVCFSCFGDETAYEDHLGALLGSRHWRTEVSQDLTRRLKKIPEVLRLTPTARSQLRR